MSDSAPRLPSPAYWAAAREHRRNMSRRLCSHPDASKAACNGPIVRAHTVQRSGSLSRIAEGGHVLAFRNDLNLLHRTGGVPQIRPVGVHDASVFTGLCRKHDDMLFAPVEKKPFAGTAEQCFLLAYRVLLRERFVKQAAVDGYAATRAVALAREEPHRSAWLDFVELSFTGQRSGLSALDRHREVFDAMLNSRDFEDMRYVVVGFAAVPDIMVGGGWWPTADFDGNLLEENLFKLGAESERPDFLTCTVLGTEGGGACVLAWHASSDSACSQFAASMIGAVTEGRSSAVPRFILQTFENAYIRPSWWAGLDDEAKRRVVARLLKSLDPFRGYEAGALVEENGDNLPGWTPTELQIRVTHGDSVVCSRTRL